MSARPIVAVFSHARADATAGAVLSVIELAEAHGFDVMVDVDEGRRHPELASRPGIIVDDGTLSDVAVAVAIGGDGTILRALRRFAGTGVGVFGVNFGEVGFLATVERDEVPLAFKRALEGEFERLTLPGIETQLGDVVLTAINDIAITRRPGDRVADLSYAIGEQEVGRVRCDGIVIATPAGSTGYNLANGGPVLAWGVEGFVVSFIAPHSLTARALVVAPDDVLTVRNFSEAPVDLSIDGRPSGEIAAGGLVCARFRREVTDLALLPGWSFYARLREKFGQLASS
ncbi:unannotated protein [freshwater metagenome]|uniref:Unannotated protein n=1 Tax=freshwater metagenome TaxID=449393 RepID=A0A6J7E108_9ZZZZ|nr:NAD(+)/NADH kinase [Actinomycetota bacterium]